MQYVLLNFNKQVTDENNELVLYVKILSKSFKTFDFSLRIEPFRLKVNLN